MSRNHWKGWLITRPDTILFWRFWHERPAPSRRHKLSNMKGPAQVAVRGAIDSQPVLFLAKYTDAVLQRIRSGVANGRGRGVYASKLHSKSRNRLPMTVCLSSKTSSWNSISPERKRHVERARADDISTNAQPIRGEVRVTDPCLQVRNTRREWRTRCNRLGCR